MRAFRGREPLSRARNGNVEWVDLETSDGGTYEIQLTNLKYKLSVVPANCTQQKRQSVSFAWIAFDK